MCAHDAVFASGRIDFAILILMERLTQIKKLRQNLPMAGKILLADYFTVVLSIRKKSQNEARIPSTQNKRQVPIIQHSVVSQRQPYRNHMYKGLRYMSQASSPLDLPRCARVSFSESDLSRIIKQRITARRAVPMKFVRNTSHVEVLQPEARMHSINHPLIYNIQSDIGCTGRGNLTTVFIKKLK